MSTEEWRPIPSAPGYEASNRGRIRSQLAPNKGAIKKARIGAARPGWVGYPMVDVQIGEPGARRGRRRYVHHLVAEAFIGPRPTGAVLRHLDGNPHNPSADNLTYGTISENLLDMRVHGTHFYGSRTHCNHGHEFTEENTHPRPGGGRRCVKCRRQRSAAYKARMRAAKRAAREPEQEAS